MMQISNKILTELNDYQVENGERLLWIALRLATPEPDGFFLLQVEEWSEKYKIPPSSLKKYLKTLEAKGLIRRDYRNLEKITRYPVIGSGRYLFVKVFEPQPLNNMTFFGKFYTIETNENQYFKTITERIVFKDVYNIPDTIRFAYAFAEIEPDEDMEEVRNMTSGEHVVFKAFVKKNDNNRPYLSKIWNIKHAIEYHNGRH